MSFHANNTSDVAPSLARRVLTMGLLLVATAYLAWLLATRAGELFTANDFVQYWSASRLNRTGGNPYDPEQLLHLQRAVGWSEPVPVMMWNPPWVLPIVAPFGLLPFEVARTAWLLALMAAVILASYLSWEVYDGPRRRYPLALILAVLFLPTLGALQIGQISPLILLGVASFLCATKCGWWGLAGVSAMLLSIKPHLLYLFWPVFFVWCIRERRWIALAACAGTALALSLIALVQNPSVLAQYVQTSTSEPPLYWRSSTLGTILRLTWGAEKDWLQFAPSAPGLGWGAWYWMRHRHAWDWREHTPLLLLVSVTTASYGWTYDLIVLVPVLVQATVWAVRSHHTLPLAVGSGLFVAINGLALAIIMRGGRSWHELWWMAPTLLLAYLLLRATVRRVAPETLDPTSA